MQMDDIQSVKLLSTSWYTAAYIAYTAKVNELAALHLNGWLAFTSISQCAFRVSTTPALYRSAMGYYYLHLHLHLVI